MATTLDPGDFEFSTDRARLDFDRIEAFMRQSYRAASRPRELIERSFANSSICLGCYRKADGVQVGVCRVVTDFLSFGWLADVFIDEEVRGQTIGTRMIETLVALKELAGVRLVLSTADAQTFYAKHGFEALPRPERWMVRRSPDSTL